MIRDGLIVEQPTTDIMLNLYSKYIRYVIIEHESITNNNNINIFRWWVFNFLMEIYE